MPALDPDAATAAWLARIPQAERLAAASATHAALWIWLLTGLVVVLASLAVLKLGLLERPRGAIERERPRPWLASAALAGVFVLILLLATAPFSLAARRSLAELWRQDLALLLAAVVLTPLVLAVARARPRSWWLWCGAPAAGLVFAWAWLPFVLAGGPGGAPAPAGPVKASLVNLLAETRLPTSEIYVSPAPGFDADVTGGFGHARVTVTRGLLDAPPAEARAYVGHLMGHYAHGDVLTLALVLAGLVLAGFLAVQLLFAPLARLLRAGARHPAEPAGLPVAALIVAVVVGLGQLVEAGVLRAVNVRADAYALDHSREPDGLAAALIRDWDGKAMAPSALETALFYTHPPLASRIHHAMTWKRAHP